MKWRHRMALVLLLPLVALLVSACEDGDPVEITPGTGQEIDLVVTSPDNPVRGEPVDIRATVTEEGEPVRSVNVTFSATAGSGDAVFQPNPVSTSIEGTADTVLSTTASGTQATVTVIATTADATQRLTVYF